MKVWSAITAGVAGLFISTAALACDLQDAERKWMEAEKAGIILGTAMIQGVPSFAIDLPTWKQLGYQTRTGMVKNYQCLIAGPNNVLRKAHVITKGGKILAVWNGVSGVLDIK